MAQKSFLRKNATKTLPQKAMNGAVRGVGAAGSAYLSNTALKDVVREYHGPIFFGLGLFAEVFVDNPMVEAAAQGMQSYGAIDSARLLLPGSIDSFGLAPIDSGSDDLGNVGDRRINATPVEVAAMLNDLAEAAADAAQIQVPGSEFTDTMEFMDEGAMEPNFNLAQLA